MLPGGRREATFLFRTNRKRPDGSTGVEAFDPQAGDEGASLLLLWPAQELGYAPTRIKAEEKRLNKTEGVPWTVDLPGDDDGDGDHGPWVPPG